MAKLELDLKHGNNVVGSTSIDLNGVPQFSLAYFSARPNKVPIPMNDSLIATNGGLDYIGPLQPRAGFLSGNTYTVEVTVLNAPVGTIVELDTRELQTVSGDRPDSVPGVIITPINGGATNQARVAEFQVNFSTYPADPNNFYWYGFKWVMTTSVGTFVDPTPQAVTFGGYSLNAGLKRRLNEDNLADRIIDIHPGQYGFWVDIQIGGGGGGMASWKSSSNSASSSGKDGGSVSLFYADPANILYRYPWTADANANHAIPIAFTEGGQGQIVPSGWGGIAGKGVGGVSAVFPEFGRVGDDFQRANLIIEKVELRNGTSGININNGEMRYIGGYLDRVINPPFGTHAGEGWATIGAYGSGSGSYAIVRLHLRRRSADGNLPIKPLSLRLTAGFVPGQYHGTIKGSVHYGGGVEIKDPHSKVENGAVTEALTNTRQLPLLKTSSKGGLGGTGYPDGGRAGRPGTIGILDFGYYTSYA